MKPLARCGEVKEKRRNYFSLPWKQSKSIWLYERFLAGESAIKRYERADDLVRVIEATDVRNV